MVSPYLERKNLLKKVGKDENIPLYNQSVNDRQKDRSIEA